jgi:hypothetical protein
VSVREVLKEIFANSGSVCHLLISVTSCWREALLNHFLSTSKPATTNHVEPGSQILKRSILSMASAVTISRLRIRSIAMRKRICIVQVHLAVACRYSYTTTRRKPQAEVQGSMIRDQQALLHNTTTVLLIRQRL